MENTEVEVLLIEDNNNDAEMTFRALRKHNMANHLIHPEDGAIVVQYLFGTGQYQGRDISLKPKVILLDLNCPSWMESKSCKK